jgi:hypothetical protein
MTGPRACGTAIPRDGSVNDLPLPDHLRLAVEVFANDLDIDASPQHMALFMVLRDLHDHLWDRETDRVARTGLSSHYLIIRPVNPLRLPGPEVMAEIRDAIAALSRHGMLFGTGDDH